MLKPQILASRSFFAVYPLNCPHFLFDKQIDFYQRTLSRENNPPLDIIDHLDEFVALNVNTTCFRVCLIDRVIDVSYNISYCCMFLLKLH